MKTYIPNPIDLSDVILDSDFTKLQESIAENAHEVWAKKRQCEGWTYGEKRDDVLKQTPDMVPYKDLPEGEKEYDRKMATDTIKLIRKLGYDIVHKQETPLYKTFIRRAIGADQPLFYCNHKGRNGQICKEPIYPGYVFCPACGCELTNTNEM
ncbi:MAG: hypothetical protein KBS70_04085 [Bacteroidales bacterium]|nr:hypothetical protein [Candidatus Colicola equi]